MGLEIMSGTTVQSKIIKNIFSLSRPRKLAIQLMVDLCIIFFCFWLAMVIRLDGIYTKVLPISWISVTVVAPATLFTFLRLGLYRAVVRFIAEKALKAILFGSAISCLIMLTVSQYFSLEVPRSVPIIYFLLLILSIGGTRLFIRTLYYSTKSQNRTPIVICGAGEGSEMLIRLLSDNRKYRPVAFVDDDRPLRGMDIAGTPVVSFDNAKGLINRNGVTTALIAYDENDADLQRKAASRMLELGVEPRIIPKITDLISGNVNLSTSRRLQISELLGRASVSPDPTLMRHTIKEKSVLVTGAGGTIGSELCRQIIHQEPSRLVLFDVSEYSLYTILEELTQKANELKLAVDLVPVLGSVVDSKAIEQTIRENCIETLYHAAAYKHVPLVECNALQGVINNVSGTYLIAKAAGQLGVKHFALISSDKAVRPTNIMGATKRLSELAMQQSAKVHPATRFCAVRFGNVLGSSGSVVPKFERQIKEGGPITLTHLEITRYFMTVTEAAQLVIQASAMAKDGEIYILKMGEPVRILNLAETMCTLQGKKLHRGNKTETPNNAIDLVVTGLRPGEKLYEELLLTGLENPTQHPMIMCEPASLVAKVDIEEFVAQVQELNDSSDLIQILSSLPIDYDITHRHSPPSTL